MTTTNKKPSLRDQIINQAASTADELYAKRNAFLAASTEEQTLDDQNQVSSQVNLTNSINDQEISFASTDSQSNLTSNIKLIGQNEPTNVIDRLVSATESAQKRITGKMKLTIPINEQKNLIDIHDDQINLTELIKFTGQENSTNMVKPISLGNNLINGDEVKSIDEFKLTNDMANLNSSIDSNLPLYDQMQLPSQAETNGPLGKLDLPVKSTLPFISQLESPSQEVLPINAVKTNLTVKINSPKSSQTHFNSQFNLTTTSAEITRSVGLSGVGMLALLTMLISPDGSYIRTRNLARDLGMTYQALLNQLKRLTEAGYLESTSGTPEQGRWIRITPTGQLGLTRQANFNTSCSSSSDNI
jgi:DNA-binding MarR family transcriptional regulator